MGVCGSDLSNKYDVVVRKDLEKARHVLEFLGVKVSSKHARQLHEPFDRAVINSDGEAEGLAEWTFRMEWGENPVSAEEVFELFDKQYGISEERDFNANVGKACQDIKRQKDADLESIDKLVSALELLNPGSIVLHGDGLTGIHGSHNDDAELSGIALSAALVARRRRTAVVAPRKMSDVRFEFVVADGGKGGGTKKMDQHKDKSKVIAECINNVDAASKTYIVIVPTTLIYRSMASQLQGCIDLAVEIGSGYGNTTAALARAVGSKQKCIGIDQSWKKAKCARENYPGIRFERLDILEDMAFVQRVCLEQADACQGSGRWKHIVTFIDIGGVRELSALVRIIPWAVEHLGSALVVVKSKRLAANSEKGCGGKYTEVLQIATPSKCLCDTLKTGVKFVDFTTIRKLDVSGASKVAAV
eukprot:g1216.t1